MGVETRYHRSDTHTINGLLANKLLTSRSGTAGLLTGSKRFGGDETIWRSDVITRKNNGSEVTIGSNIASVSRTTDGLGIQSNTWACPATTIASTKNISTVARASNIATIVTTAVHGLSTGDVVTVSAADGTFNATSVSITVTNTTTFTYANTGSDVATKADAGSLLAFEYAIKVVEKIIEYSGATLNFITEKLMATNLDAVTWTFYRYTEYYNADYGSDYLHYDTATYNTRITNFSWSSGSQLTKSLGDTLTLSDAMGEKQVGKALSDSFALTDVIAPILNFDDLFPPTGGAATPRITNLSKRIKGE